MLTRDSSETWFAVELTGPAGPAENADRLRQALRQNGHRFFHASFDPEEPILVRLCDPHPHRELLRLMQGAGLQGSFLPEHDRAAFSRDQGSPVSRG
jgi:hypothetical protein